MTIWPPVSEWKCCIEPWDFLLFMGGVALFMIAWVFRVADKCTGCPYCKAVLGCHAATCGKEAEESNGPEGS